MSPPSTPQLVAMVLYSPLDISCFKAWRSACPSPEPLAIAQPYGADEKTSPAASSLPFPCLIAYAVTGESADIAPTLPSISAVVASSWKPYLEILIGGLPLFTQSLLFAGSSSVSWMVPVWTATLLPHALFGSTFAPACCAHCVPAWKYVTKSTCASRSLLSVNDEAPTSYVPAVMDGMMLSNFDGR